MAADERGPSLAALTVPGLGPVLADQARRLGFRAGPVENDGRADVVALDGPVGNLAGLRSAEEVLLCVGELARRASAQATVATLRPDRLRRAVGQWLSLNSGRPRRFRVVARVRDETAFRRSALRDAMAAQAAAVTGWRPDQDSQGGLEMWVLQVDSRRYRVGLRLAALGTRTDPPRAMELAGSLRPAVAAAMVHLAGTPSEVLLDPCCGSGTILVEAARSGWSAIGSDMSPAAIRAARLNTRASVHLADVRRQPLRARSAGVVVTNLPFGLQHPIEGLPVAWYRRALTEIMRVAPRAVLLAGPTDPFRRALGRLRVELLDRRDLRLLGRPATIWVIEGR